MTPEQLSALISAALTALVERGAITLSELPAAVAVERPRSKEHGDYATNVALQLGKKAGMNPRDFAALLAAELEASDGIAKVDIAGPGFLNITVEAGAQGKVAADIVAAGKAYGRSELLAGTKINVEFISANPTGPLHLGHTRWAVLGDAIARVLEAAGADVTREFYINDRGNQMNNFAASIIASATGQPKPEDGYAGEYVDDLAKLVGAAEPGIF
ncbi:MAG: arginine--tRNA ligase domain-containing protein [Marmoricola sp.]